MNTGKKNIKKIIKKLSYSSDGSSRTWKRPKENGEVVRDIYCSKNVSSSNLCLPAHIRVFVSNNVSMPIKLHKKLSLADNILDYGSLKLSFKALNQEISDITNLEPNWNHVILNF